MPRSCMARSVGAMIVSITCVMPAGTLPSRQVYAGSPASAGQYAPMPPVFGPVSPSPTRL